MIICGRDRNHRMMPSSTSATQSHQFNIGDTDKLRHCQPFCVGIFYICILYIWFTWVLQVNPPAQVILNELGKWKR